MRPVRILIALALAALVACDTSPAPQHGFSSGGFTGGGFAPPGGGFTWGSGGFVGGGGFLPFPWFRLDAGASIDAPIDAPSSTTMSVAITDSADPVITGADAYSYAVTLTNTGAVNATTVSVATTLDASLAYVSSSGTGWSCSQSGGVVTCTAASLAPGAAPAITINVTTGTSGVSASTSVLATASNASNATGSQGTTVQLVSKDALAGIYVPASSTEWTNFIARKGLSISVPDSLWLMQDASSGAVDAIGSINLAQSGTAPTYQTAETGWSRKGISFADGSTSTLSSTSASLPDISTTSQLTLVYADVTASTVSTRAIVTQGTTTEKIRISNTPRMVIVSNANTATGAASPLGVVRPYELRTNRTAGSCTGFDDAEKVTPTFSTGVTGKQIVIGAGAGAPPAFNAVYAAQWQGAHAEMSDADLRSLDQALGWSPAW